MSEALYYQRRPDGRFNVWQWTLVGVVDHMPTATAAEPPPSPPPIPAAAPATPPPRPAPAPLPPEVAELLGAGLELSPGVRATDPRLVFIVFDRAVFSQRAARQQCDAWLSADAAGAPIPPRSHRFVQTPIADMIEAEGLAKFWYARLAHHGDFAPTSWRKIRTAHAGVFLIVADPRAKRLAVLPKVSSILGAVRIQPKASGR